MASDLNNLLPMTTDLSNQLGAAIEALALDDIAESIARSLEIPLGEATEQLSTYVNESWVALELIEPHLQPDTRILEIGSGIGFFAGFLCSQGYDVVELEPVGSAFEFIGATRAALPPFEPAPRLLGIGAESLDPATHGEFDLIYSLNVLEHVPDWRGAMDAVGSVLAPDGTMYLSCPNYTFPYEPHFGVLLVPGRPAATERLLPARIKESDLWRSLNWITLSGVRNWADDNGYAADFETGRLADSLERLSTDEQFANRHSRVLEVGARTANRVGLLSLLRKVPASWTSPMVFTVQHRPENCSTHPYPEPSSRARTH